MSATATFKLPAADQALPELAVGPVSRLDLALYCGASGDHNPIHVDIDFARRAGMDDVFAHGMLSMAYLGRVLTDWVPQSWIEDYAVRFSAITPVGARLRCSARVSGVSALDHGWRLRLVLAVLDQNDELKIKGEATVRVPAEAINTVENDHGEA
ncbi:MaoC/PaaZ C-terminal domain-containing protein [Alloalcanivorax gelatiniphagus]|mgnify:FL=1|uniref:Dehydratase n=1 Tax=Alloalcanivorax gelatiniphagus TaxID=1194167 RepID=A0ABY2XNH1_9GAMM|nr:MaoC/PaaZ C-terminal domain-containing protein [Alloalcanivorax gelatiniphagus]TMW13982.1 dehydratase [Alloalcanivorax gelatiniphagus]|tara:strand:- start:12091 stop:12555 length:465 start_codon:yes stop_codon:yes gene_type:complete